MKLDKFLLRDPYSLDQEKKNFIFNRYLNELTLHHFYKSKKYKKLLYYLGYSKQNQDIHLLPFLPVRLFKELELVSVKKDLIIKTLNSSGTSGNKKSKIYLDKENALNQVKVLQKIITKTLGKDRLPMLIIDQNLKK